MCIRGKTCELKNYETKTEQKFSMTTTCLQEQVGEDRCHIQEEGQLLGKSWQ